MSQIENTAIFRKSTFFIVPFMTFLKSKTHQMIPQQLPEGGEIKPTVPHTPSKQAAKPPMFGGSVHSITSDSPVLYRSTFLYLKFKKKKKDT